MEQDAHITPKGGEPDTTPDLLTDLYTWITSTIDICDTIHAATPSRELSLVKTKLDEAEMWLINLLGKEES